MPVIASGGVGNLSHLSAGVLEGGADAVLAASIFHFGEYTVKRSQTINAGKWHRSSTLKRIEFWVSTAYDYALLIQGKQ